MAKRKSKNNKSTGYALLFILFIAVCAMLSYWYYATRKISEAKFAHYPAFGIDLPGNYEIHGIDVSRFQSFIDWPSVKRMQVKDVKIGFSFMKATEGLGNVDRQFRRNWKKAREAKMIKGAYHFFLANKSGKAQAYNFISTVNLGPGDLPPVLDVEQLYGVKPEKMRKEVKAWLQVVEEYYGVKPIIYTYATFYSTHLAGTFDDYPLWIAHYLEKNQPRVKRKWSFWQHSERGRVNGIAHRVDFNVFNGDSAAFKALLIE